jgi:hypothetical protein
VLLDDEVAITTRDGSGIGSATAHKTHTRCAREALRWASPAWTLPTRRLASQQSWQCSPCPRLRQPPHRRTGLVPGTEEQLGRFDVLANSARVNQTRAYQHSWSVATGSRLITLVYSTTRQQPTATSVWILLSTILENWLPWSP